MYNRIKLGLVAAFVAISMAFGGGAIADDKKAAAHDCGYCTAVKDVMNAMRCAGCKDAAMQCAHCKDASHKMMATAMCQGCGEMAKKDGAAAKPVAACADCAKAMPKDMGHCKFCAEKAMVADHMYCCDKCKSAKNADCPKCKEMRATVMKMDCADCAKGKK